MAQEWISVKDMLPTSIEDVLVWDGEHISVGWYDTYSKGWTSYLGSIDGATHWMPLPEPPKEEE